MAGRFHRALAGASLSLAALALLLPASAAGATPSAAKAVSFDVSIGSPCIGVEGPMRARGTLAVRTGAGRLRGNVDVRLDREGQARECIISLLSGVTGGDIVSFKIDGVRTSWRVPRLAMAIDRAADTYTLHGAAGTEVAVSGIRGIVRGDFRELFDDEVVIDPAGSVTHDPGVDLIGADVLQAWVEDGDNVARLTMYAPFLSVTIGDAIVSGAVAPGPDGVVRLSRGGSVLGRGSAASIVDGQFYARLRTLDDRPVPVAAGDRIVLDGASQIRMRVQPASVRADPRTETIRGTCGPHVLYSLLARSSFSSDRFMFVQVRGRTDATGAFRRVVREDLRKGDELSLVCQDAKGDVTSIERVIPR